MSEIERNHIPQSDSGNGNLQSSGANDKKKKYDEISLDSRIIVDENNNY
jgi:hypothetical protein